MKSLWAVPAILLVLYLVEGHGRRIDSDDYEIHEEDERSELINRMRDHSTQSRHHRRPRQSFGYDYPLPPFYDYRRDYGMRQQEEYFTRILKSLDEIISYLRRSPPPAPAPQPIYIPYPVLQYRPCSRPSSSNRPEITTLKPDVNSSSTQIPDFTVRWPEMDDENQNWGLDPVEVQDEDNQDDGARPISFDPIQPSRPTSRPAPPVEHGSNQAGLDTTTAAPVRRPGACETAILTCCSLPDRTSQRNCFARFDCLKTFATNRACDANVIKRVLEHFSKAYAPIKNNI